jgi:hypothetical protein
VVDPSALPRGHCSTQGTKLGGAPECIRNCGISRNLPDDHGDQQRLGAGCIRQQFPRVCRRLRFGCRWIVADFVGTGCRRTLLHAKPLVGAGHHLHGCCATLLRILAGVARLAECSSGCILVGSIRFKRIIRGRGYCARLLPDLLDRRVVSCSNLTRQTVRAWSLSLAGFCALPEPPPSSAKSSSREHLGSPLSEFHRELHLPPDLYEAAR